MVTYWMETKIFFFLTCQRRNTNTDIHVMHERVNIVIFKKTKQEKSFILSVSIKLFSMPSSYYALISSWLETLLIYLKLSCCMVARVPCIPHRWGHQERQPAWKRPLCALQSMLSHNIFMLHSSIVNSELGNYIYKSFKSLKDLSNPLTEQALSWQLRDTV